MIDNALTGLGKRCLGVLLLTAAALLLSVTTPAHAVTAVSFFDGVYRFRDSHGQGDWKFSLATPTTIVAVYGWPLRSGPGCAPIPPVQPFGQVACSSGQTSAALPRPRYRLNFSAGYAGINVDLPGLHGVVFAGPGNDGVTSQDRVYGGPGDDLLRGPRLHGGPGRDELRGVPADRRTVLRGGPGDDYIPIGARRVYGGPGVDNITGSRRTADMLVGGPGHDDVDLGGPDRKRDVLRMRDDRFDIVHCRGGADREDVLLVDRSDDVYRRECRRAQILLDHGRPRLLAPP